MFTANVDMNLYGVFDSRHVDDSALCICHAMPCHVAVTSECARMLRAHVINEN